MKVNNPFYFLIGATIALCFISFSCNKNSTQQPMYINATFKDYFNYQPGSYWVFYDSSNNEKDSYYVTSNEDYFPFTNNTPNEEIFINIHSNINQELLRFGMGVNAAGFDFEDTFNDIFSESLINNQYAKLFDTITSPFYKLFFFEKYIIGTNSYTNVYMAINSVAPGGAYFSHESDTIFFNYSDGFIGFFYNNSYLVKRLVLINSKLIR